jgi:hypothetical protein
MAAAELRSAALTSLEILFQSNIHIQTGEEAHIVLVSGSGGRNRHLRAVGCEILLKVSWGR